MAGEATCLSISINYFVVDVVSMFLLFFCVCCCCCCTHALLRRKEGEVYDDDGGGGGENMTNLTLNTIQIDILEVTIIDYALNKGELNVRL